MQPISKEQIKRLNALGAASGLKDGHPDDNYHTVIFNLTGKSSTKELTGDEFTAVERELMNHMRGGARLQRRWPSPNDATRQPGMMTPEQQRKAWALIYQLERLSPKAATPGERMVGAVRKILNVEAAVREPFRWVTFQDGVKLIDMLKRYVRSAGGKQQKAGGG